MGTGDPVRIPKIAPDQIDYEGELGLVIGRRRKNVPNDKSSVLGVIAGFTVINDVSVRDWQELEPRHGGKQVLRYPRPDRPMDRDTERYSRRVMAVVRYLNS